MTVKGNTDRVVAKRQLILCLALAWATVSSAQQPVSVGLEGRDWGEISHGFQMAASLDVTNEVIHCWIRNSTSNEMDYPSGHIGYFELIDLEIMGATNRTKFQVKVFPETFSGAYGALPSHIKRIQPGKVITDTYVRTCQRPWPVLSAEEYLRVSHGNTNEALLTEQLNRRMAARQKLLTELCSNDTFALDLIARNVSDLKGKESLKVRVTQTILLKDGEQKVTISSQPFILDGSLIEACIQRDRELWGK